MTAYHPVDSSVEDLLHQADMASAWRANHPNRAQHKLSEHEKRRCTAFESLDFEVAWNVPYRRERQQLRARPREKGAVAVYQWIVFALAGLATGTMGFAIDEAVAALTSLKLRVVGDLLSGGGTARLLAAFIVLALINLALAGASAVLVVWVAPAAGGSGIPEVKGFLNGTNVPGLLSLRTLAAKVLGIVLSVSAGLLIGKEGPLIHTGAILAANLGHMPRLRRLLPHASWPFLFRNDRAKRDFVSGGAAAGVAAAFGAPIGGVLFALEEASSFWSVPLTWRVFFCAMVGAFSLNMWRVWLQGKKDFGGLVTFGAPDHSRTLYELWELPLFIALAAGGGLVGAAFCELNKRLCRWRRAYMADRPRARLVEVLLITAVSTCASFWLPVAFGNGCHVLPPGGGAASGAGANTPQHYERFTCEPGQYNAMASVVFAGNRAAIRAFFHNSAPLTAGVLVAYSLVAFVLAVLTYGAAVPSGLFVPCILVGSASGRLLGEHMEAVHGPGAVNPGTYALVGAVAMLGGVTRITICLTVIMLETTGNIESLLPIMLVVMVSKWVGDCFNISLYDMHIELKCMPFVEAGPPEELEALAAKDVMCGPAVAVRETETVGSVLRLLRATQHSGFPVVSSSSGKLLGLITRNQLVVILRHRVAKLTQMWDSSYALREEQTVAGRVHSLARRSGWQAARRVRLPMDMEMTAPALEELDDALEDVDVDVDAGADVGDVGPGASTSAGAGQEGAGEEQHETLELRHFAATLHSKTIGLASIEALLGFERDGDDEQEKERVRGSELCLRPYWNPDPVTVQPGCCIEQCFRLFRGLGLRHLCVVNDVLQPVGLITRKDLMSAFAQDLF